MQFHWDIEGGITPAPYAVARVIAAMNKLAESGPRMARAFLQVGAALRHLGNPTVVCGPKPTHAKFCRSFHANGVLVPSAMLQARRDWRRCQRMFTGRTGDRLPRGQR